MAYKNPILNEIYYEFFFEKGISLNEQFDIANFLKNDGFEKMEHSPVIENYDSDGSIPIRIRLWRNNKRELFQIFSNRIAFNYIPFNVDGGKYEGWQSFLSKCLDIQNKFKSICNISGKQISLCYIDKREISDDSFKLGKYINCNSRYVPEFFEDACLDSDLIIGNGRLDKDNNMQLRIGFNNISSNKYILHINTLFNSLDSFKSDIESALNGLHGKCVGLFEEIITDHMRNIVMGGTL